MTGETSFRLHGALMGAYTVGVIASGFPKMGLAVLLVFLVSLALFDETLYRWITAPERNQNPDEPKP